MSDLYVACELGAEKGRVLLGALQKEGLTVSEAGEFDGLTTQKEGAVQWDVPRIYQSILSSIRSIVAQQEPVRGVSFYSPVSDCLLFEDNGSLIAPATRCEPEEATAELKKLIAKVPLDAFYNETGLQPDPTSALCQLANEPSRRLKRAAHAMSLADSFNYLFSGVARAEASQAHRALLYNPGSKSWSDRLLQAAGIPSKLLPHVNPAGTVLGEVRADISRDSGLHDARVVAACSHELSAVLAALSIADPGNWAFLAPGETALLGTKLEAPSINELSCEMKYSNLVGYNNCVGFYKSWPGLKLVEQCRRTWAQQDRSLDNEVLMHLATSAIPFEALIDPSDPRFLSAEDMPQAIQTFCRETGQEVPRKPGPTLRCILESLALEYRRGLLEMEYITGTSFSRLYVLGGKSNLLLNHFLTNALELPVAVVPTNVAGVGNVAIQAMAMGHIETPEEARDLVRHSLRLQIINPHATAWTEAYDRFLSLSQA